MVTANPAPVVTVAPWTGFAPPGCFPIPPDSYFQGVAQEVLNNIDSNYTIINGNIITGYTGLCQNWTTSRRPILGRRKDP